MYVTKSCGLEIVVQAGYVVAILTSFKGKTSGGTDEEESNAIDEVDHSECVQR
jgi:hypothetical protein